MSPTHALLGLLLAGEQHGYQLKRRVDREFAPFWRIDFAQLYRSLAKLARAGRVRVRREPGAAAPGRKVYALTVHGRRALKEWLDQPATDQDEFLVKVRFASEAKVPVVHLLDTQRETWKSQYERGLVAQRQAAEARDRGQLLMATATVRRLEAARASLALCEAVCAFGSSSIFSAPRSAPLRITGSDDPLLVSLAESARASTQVVGSLGGLLALARGGADIAGVHLLDAETGTYNLPYVRRLLTEDKLVLLNLAARENGLMLAPGNPKGIRALRDLTRRGVRFINRARGTGTRHLLALRLRAAHIDPRALKDWERTAATHEAVAGAIACGTADAGPGLRAVAAKWGLDFIMLGEEQFDLVLKQETLDSPRARPLLDALHAREFHQAAAAFAGYDLSRSGKIVARIK